MNVVRYSTIPRAFFGARSMIGDDRVFRIARIDLAVGDASNFFVRSSRIKRLTVERRLARNDLDPDDFGGGGTGEPTQHGTRACDPHESHGLAPADVSTSRAASPRFFLVTSPAETATKHVRKLMDLLPEI